MVKAKSMTTEEIHLNGLLEGAGIAVAETDLGEYIVQLAGEAPSHIIAPAIHKRRGAIGRLFADKLGIPYSDDPATLTLAARQALRKKFLKEQDRKRASRAAEAYCVAHGLAAAGPAEDDREMPVRDDVVRANDPQARAAKVARGRMPALTLQHMIALRGHSFGVLGLFER